MAIDANNDGLRDIVTAIALHESSVGADTLFIGYYLNEGNGFFSGTPVLIGPVNTVTNSYSYTLSKGDMDGDGKEDIVVSLDTGLGPTLWWHRKNATAGFDSRTVILSSGISIMSCGVADIDSDSDLDILLISRYDNTNRCLLNNGIGMFTASNVISTVAAADFHYGDIDNDGDLDFASIGPETGLVTIAFNDGFGGFADLLLVQTPAIEQQARVHFLDVDLDSYPELVVSSRVFQSYVGPEKTFIYSNLATDIPSFSESPIILHTPASNLCSGIDETGLPVLVLSGNNGIVRWSTRSGQVLIKCM